MTNEVKEFKDLSVGGKETNYFSELASVEVGNYIEQKGQFNYLSWAYAVQEIKKYDPNASWETRWFKDPQTGAELPYALGPNGAFVEVSVTVKGRTHKQIQPVIDYKNKSITNPDAMDVNKAIQRCLVKAIALHGLGLYIYAGEDLPNDMISGLQQNTIYKLAEQYVDIRERGTVEELLSSIGVKSIVHLTSAQANMTINKLQSLVKKAKEMTKEEIKQEVKQNQVEEKGA